MSFIAENKDILILCVSVLGVLLALCFGGVLDWRVKICIDYQDRLSVAVNILQDRYIQRTSTQHTEIAAESISSGASVEDIYNRQKQRDVIRELADTLDDSNRIKRYFHWLEQASVVAFRSLWAAIVLSLLTPLGLYFLTVSLKWIWGCLLVSSLLIFIAAISALSYLDGRFFNLVNRVIEPEETK